MTRKIIYLVYCNRIKRGVDSFEPTPCSIICWYVQQTGQASLALVAAAFLAAFAALSFFGSTFTSHAIASSKSGIGYKISYIDEWDVCNKLNLYFRIGWGHFLLTLQILQQQAHRFGTHTLRPYIKAFAALILGWQSDQSLFETWGPN